MRITDIHVDGFGMWKGLSLDDLSAGLTVFYGPNEAGKTTLLQLVRCVLYGLDDKRRRRYLPPAYGGRAGGSVGVRCPMGQLRIQRHWDPAPGGEREQHVVEGADGRPVGAAVLRNALGGIDESMFNNVFAVGLTELQQLGSLSDSQAAQHLYGLAMGTDRVSLADVRRELNHRCQQLLGTGSDERRESSPIRDLLKQRQRLRESLRQTRASTRQWSKLMQHRVAIDQETAKLESRSAPDTGELSWDQWMRTSEEKWRQAAELNGRLKGDRETEIPSAAVERLRETGQQIEQHEEQLAESLRQQDLVRLEAGDGLDREEPQWDVAPVLELADQRARVRSLVEATRQTRRKVEECEFEFQAELEKQGFPGADRAEGALLWGSKALAALSDPVRMVEDQQLLVEQLQRESEDRRREADELKQRYRDALARLGIQRVDQAEDAIREQCELLRERIALQDRWDKLGREQRGFLDEARYWARRMVLPWRLVLMFGAVFCVGATMVLAAWWSNLFGVAAGQRQSLALLGICLLGGSFVMRRAMELTAQRRWDECREQARRQRRMREQVADAASAIDRQLPAAQGPWIKQLDKAQHELREVQALNPLYDRQQQALAEVDLLSRRVAEATAGLKDAQRGWRQALLTLGLPDHLSHDEVRAIMSDSGPLMKIRTRLESLRAEQRAREAELDAVQQKINRFADRLQLNLILSEEDAEQRLVTVVEAARKLRESQQTLAQARAKMRQLQREEQQHRQAIEVLTKRRQQIVDQYRGVDAQEIEARFQQQQKEREMRGQRDALLDELSGLLGGRFSADQLRQSLPAPGQQGQSVQLNQSGQAGQPGQPARTDKILEALREWNAQHEAAERALGEARQARDKVVDQIKSLTRDEQPARDRLKLEATETQLRKLLREWAALATMSHVLDGIRSSYEAERQPVALTEASLYLSQLTGGRYTRIWTPFGEASLSVDDHDGQPLPVSKLSRGTREQVYLSLRLALAAEYGRRGSPMPIVLDDVFVNFDTRRSRLAAKALKDYADQGHQVLVFTCHDHIRDMYQSLGCDVRTLPDARVVAGLLRPEDVEIPKPAETLEPAVAVVDEPVQPIEPEVEAEPLAAHVPVVPLSELARRDRRREKKRRRRRMRDWMERHPITVPAARSAEPPPTVERTVEVQLSPAPAGGATVSASATRVSPIHAEGSSATNGVEVETVWVDHRHAMSAAGASELETIHWRPLASPPPPTSAVPATIEIRCVEYDAA